MAQGLPPLLPALEAQAQANERLHAAILRYQAIEDAGGWPTIPPGPTIEPGSGDPRVPGLAKRLQATGDLRAAGREFLEYDETLQNAVRHFQKRHGLEQDALVGRATLRALNVPARQRTRQLCINLERMSALHDEDRPDYLRVNIPAFQASLMRDHRPVWATNVVIGEKDAETPLFESAIHTVVVNPTWAVPRSIASEELLPKIQHDVGFLARGGYDVLDAAGQLVDPANIDWAALSLNSFPYRLVQQPGPKNELGQVKFLFDNPFGVCMHDTPSKYLFEYSSRAFSHGCIRMQRPLEFAALLLADEGWTEEQLDEELASGQTHRVSLSEALPLVVTYLTANVDAAGTVYFYRDVYKRDAQFAACSAGTS